jgi:RNA polymerase primary sigma factor
MFETSDNLPYYFRSISKLQPLTTEEELALADRVRAGDEAAIHKLVRHNLKIVVTIARRHVGQGVGIDDLIQEGNIGLYEAARRYDPQGNGRFITYAQLWVRKRINGVIDQHGRIVRLPANQTYEIYRAKVEGREHEAPTKVECDAPAFDDSESTVGDRLLSVEPEIERQIEVDQLRFTVRRAMSGLKTRDREIVKEYFGIDREGASPTDVIAERHNLTNVRVCQIVKSCVEKMRQTKPLRSK